MYSLIIIITVITIANGELGYSGDYPESLSRVPRQTEAKVCKFDIAEGTVDTCDFVLDMTRISDVEQFVGGTGEGSYWVGGPPKDALADVEGGFIFTTLSTINKSRLKKSFLFTAPEESTGPAGKCLEFKYAISGMDMDCLEVNLVEYTNKTLTGEDFLPNENDTTKIPYTFNKLSCEFGEFPDESGWATAKLTYSWNSLHSLAFVGSSTSVYASTRGYVALDEISISEGPCDNHCNFDADLCGWKNVDSTDELRVDGVWVLSRGSVDKATGPSKDQDSSTNYKTDVGGYAHLTSKWPRREGDIAIIESPDITATAVPMCLSFWANLHGGDIGSLRVNKVNEGVRTKLWEYRGHGRNIDMWYPGQLTVADTAGSTFKIEFEGEVGEPGAGDIAIDTIRFLEGPCPKLPSGTDPDSLDCTFFDDTGSWTGRELISNGIPSNNYPMISRISGNGIQPEGHTRMAYNASDMYISFDLGYFGHTARQKSALMSPVINKTEASCMSFWYQMKLGASMHTRVASLSVMLFYEDETNETIWRLSSHETSTWMYAQLSIKLEKPGRIGIVGTKGSNVVGGMIGVDDIALFESDCTTKPEAAAVTPQDCSFDLSTCGWKVKTSGARIDNWRHVDKDSANLNQDHTFKTITGGYMFIEAFSKELFSELISSPFNVTKNYCFTFYYSSYYKDSDAELSVQKKVGSADAETLWTVKQEDVPELKVRSGRVSVNWYYAQFPLPAGEADSETNMIIKGKVKMGAWTLDDIRIIEDDNLCQVRPPSANPNKKAEASSSASSSGETAPEASVPEDAAEEEGTK